MEQPSSRSIAKAMQQIESLAGELVEASGISSKQERRDKIVTLTFGLTLIARNVTQAVATP